MGRVLAHGAHRSAAVQQVEVRLQGLCGTVWGESRLYIQALYTDGCF
jgi:hypothetical protein